MVRIVCLLALGFAMQCVAQTGQLVISAGCFLPDLKKSGDLASVDLVGKRMGLSYEAGDRLRVGLGLEVEQLSYSVGRGTEVRYGRGNFSLLGVYRMAEHAKTHLDGVAGLLVGGSTVRTKDLIGDWKFRNGDESVVLSFRFGARYAYRLCNWFSMHLSPNVTIPVVQGERELSGKEDPLDVPKRSVQFGMTLGLVLGPFNVQSRTPEGP
ncbi:MAG TPA: hypothetical protein VGE21_14875 [Flavobacteriales bacterium]